MRLFSGITLLMGYCGTRLTSWFSIHVEDLHLPSVFYVLTGEPKIVFVVPRRNYQRFLDMLIKRDYKGELNEPLGAPHVRAKVAFFIPTQDEVRTISARTAYAPLLLRRCLLLMLTSVTVSVCCRDA